MKNRKIKKTHKKPLLAKTLKAAASLSKLPVHVIQNAKNSGCQAFKANGTVEIEELLDWVCENPMPTQEDVPNLFVEKALDMRANRKLKEQRYREREKELRPIGEVRRSTFRNVVACKTKLYAAENTIAVEAGMKLSLTPIAIAMLREIIQKHQRLAIKELNLGDLGKVECPECKKDIHP